MMVWLDPEGMPAGFYHETAPPDVKDLFITRLEELFNRPDRITAMSLIRGDGPPIGKMLAPGMQERFEQEEIFQYLCRPLNHRYLLDMAVRDRAGFFSYACPGRPFDHASVIALTPALPLLAETLEQSDRPLRWHSVGSGIAHMMVSADGRVLHAIDAEAEVLLRNSHLLRQNVSMIDQPRAAPGFALPIAQQLAGRQTLETDLAVPDGRLVCRARRSRLFDGAGQAIGEGLLIALDVQFAESVALIEHLFEYDLTGLQQAIVLDALQGISRSDCRRRNGLGEEALKKHLQVIYRKTGTDSWDALGDLRPQIVSAHAAQIEFRWTSDMRGMY